jgi:hypothetical protein
MTKKQSKIQKNVANQMLSINLISLVGAWIDIRKPDRHVESMIAENPLRESAIKLPVFAISCWILGMMAFTQLVIGGMALSQKWEVTRQVKSIEKEIPKIVIVRVPADQTSPQKVAHNRIEVRTPFVPSTATSSEHAIIQPTPIDEPHIDDPLSERLVKEARTARVAGNMAVAIVKLQEAQLHSPADPSIEYELGLIHEQMGVFDLATDHYQKVFQMGVSKAGSLYALAAAKLRDGIEEPEAMLGKLCLGNIRCIRDNPYTGGQRITLTIPVQRAPDAEIDTNELRIRVAFYNRTSKGEVIELSDKSWVKNEWAHQSFTWPGGEEDLITTYIIPSADQATNHLFGEQKYYGQVVYLIYKGEVLDMKASPGELGARDRLPGANPSGSFPTQLQDSLPPDFDPNAPLLLPPLKESKLVPVLPHK